jgi:hypothetical protein
MRLTPSHVRDAKEMARSLCDVLEQLGVPLDWTNPASAPPSLRQTQELMAKAMGYAGWHELTEVLKRPHEAVYVDVPDEMESARRLQALIEKMSSLMGLNYAHGTVANAIYNAGTGMSPKVRRRFADISTPWGPVIESRVLVDGITEVSTGGHGGWLLSEDRQRRMPAHLRLEEGAYEEDGEYNLVVLGFPDEAEALGCRLRDALEHMNVIAQDEDRRKHSAEMTGRLNAAARANQSLLSVPTTPYVPAPLTPIEQRVIKYLARCVYENRWPLRVPDDPQGDVPELLRCPSLDAWVAVLQHVPTVNREWAMRAGPWRRHWFWTVRHDENDAAREAHDDALFERLRLEDALPSRKE